MNCITSTREQARKHPARLLLLPFVAVTLSACGALGIQPSEDPAESASVVVPAAGETSLDQADTLNAVQFKLDAELAEVENLVDADEQLADSGTKLTDAVATAADQEAVQTEVADAEVLLSDAKVEVAEVVDNKAESERVGNWEQPRPAPVKWNMYDTMESNYVSLFADYEEVDRSILVFPNDSLRLGEANKQIIQDYVEKMDPETDLLSVIGCSHGNTDIDNGNSLLALGRANRVKEAFMFSGVQHEHVMDEGCWAPQTFDEVMPRRGVVLTLKRRKNS